MQPDDSQALVFAIASGPSMDLNAREGQCSCNTPTPSVDRTRDEELLIAKFDYARARKAPGCFATLLLVAVMSPSFLQSQGGRRSRSELVKSFLPELIRASCAKKKSHWRGGGKREGNLAIPHAFSLFYTVSSPKNRTKSQKCWPKYYSYLILSTFHQKIS